jgi:hypothetical protein
MGTMILYILKIGQCAKGRLLPLKSLAKSITDTETEFYSLVSLLTTSSLLHLQVLSIRPALTEYQNALM